MKNVLILRKLTPVNNEVLVHLKNIESPTYVLSMEALKL